MTGDPAESRLWDRWIKITDIAERYNIPVQKVRNRLQSGTWPSHHQPGIIRFSPSDQKIIEEKWQRYGGDDPPRRTPSWRELALQEHLTDEEHAAVKRGYNYSVGIPPDLD